MPNRRRQELRCFCSRAPLLALYGVGTDGKLFIHVKVFKQSRVFGEILVKGGEVSIVCRECIRWHRITIRDNSPGVTEVAKPIELEASDQE